MNIPGQAFETADLAGEYAYITGGAPGDVSKAAVLAAAPFIAAQAWREGRDAALDAFDSDGYYEGTTNPYEEES